ncbi:unnamed protein product [Schistosoma mattheei]|uniref:Uncharacterized protein n=1 Tax=Schistosoma mattheei TaxID=31246 RepID=A0A183NER2_9TREM|nr:unnamed protein product [Schistosoma mattheei]
MCDQKFAVDSVQSIGELYVSQKSSDLAKWLELTVIRSLEQLESTKRESVCYKRTSTTVPLRKKQETIRRLHEENEKLLDNLPLLCRETKQIKQQLSGQIIDTHKVAHELTSNNLLQDFNERIQDISFDRRTFTSGNTYVDTLNADNLYINCCNLYSLDPNLKIPDVLLKCILTQIKESWLAENSLKLLHYLLMNLNKEILISEKLQNYDVTFEAKELKHLLPCVANLKELSKEIRQRMSLCNELLSDWREIPIRRMLL